MTHQASEAASTGVADPVTSAFNRRFSELTAPSAARKICVFRALQLGDMLTFVPALRAVRAHWRHSQITLVGLPWAADFVRRFSHYIDDFVEFPGWPGLPEGSADADQREAFLAGMRARGFDLAIQAHGNGSIANGIVSAFGA